VPCVQGALRIRTVYDSVAFLGFFGSAFVSKVITRDKPRDLEDDVSIIIVDDTPLK